MSTWVQGVINGHAFAGSCGEVPFHYWRATAIGEDQIVTRNELAEWIRWILLNAVQSGRRIDIPKHNARAWTLKIQNCLLQKHVVDAHAAGLDDQVSIARLLHCRDDTRFGFWRINAHLRPVRIGNVAVLLTLVGVGFEERDVVAALMQRADKPTIIRGSSIPIGRHKA